MNNGSKYGKYRNRLKKYSFNPVSCWELVFLIYIFMGVNVCTIYE